MLIGQCLVDNLNLSLIIISNGSELSQFKMIFILAAVNEALVIIIKLLDICVIGLLVLHLTLVSRLHLVVLLIVQTVCAYWCRYVNLCVWVAIVALLSCTVLKNIISHCLLKFRVLIWFSLRLRVVRGVEKHELRHESSGLNRFGE